MDSAVSRHLGCHFQMIEVIKVLAEQENPFIKLTHRPGTEGHPELKDGIPDFLPPCVLRLNVLSNFVSALSSHPPLEPSLATAPKAPKLSAKDIP